MQELTTNRFESNGRCAASVPMLLVLSLTLIGGCDQSASVAAETANKPAAATCGQDGQLAVELYGSIRASIDWQADALSCAGMPRPDAEGARVRLAGPLGSGEDTRTLAFILGLPGLEAGQTGKELPTNVTLIEEGTGRFFATLDTSGCWTDVTDQEPVSANGDRVYRIQGRTYCVAPLAELNGTSSVTFTELEFTGRLSWEQPE